MFPTPLLIAFNKYPNPNLNPKEIVVTHHEMGETEDKEVADAEYAEDIEDREETEEMDDMEEMDVTE
ncbi:hypothetical protein AA0119_g7443 [Alternaria tenuissima]|uniref:Uncharacterized protein n=1 Tax=Alternaria tenuissima TaxID=119927 RepID=A0AB37VZH0_9PLEO|nr:hypothetical protein AA0115_g12318 [Alternaria tenuissima]RYN97406.1 hypothetical protein AA0119_g7443 [Alternaria tenuissima]RYO20819.1 hypothetical protein AA0121_g3314 [Alternaria tenuissima]